MRGTLLLLTLLAAACVSSNPQTPGPNQSGQGWDLTLLEEGARTYTVFYEGDPIGDYSYSLSREQLAGRPIFRVSRSFSLEEGPVEQEALFDAGSFEPISSESRGVIRADLTYTDGRVRGTVGGSNGTRQMEAEMPVGGLLPYMFEAALSVMPLRLGYATEVPVVNPASAEIENVGVRVIGESTLTVPAGTFRVYEIEITGFQPETIYLRHAKPHIAIKQDLPGPISMELSAFSAAAKR